jgi:hypothetical protein
VSELGRQGAHEIDRMVSDTRRLLSELATTGGEPGTPVEAADQRGFGSAADELVKAEVSAGGRVEKVTLEPKAMRLDSQTLGEEITKALRAAQDDLRARQPDAAGLPAPEQLTERLDGVQLQVSRQLDVFGEALEGIVRKLDQRS